METAFKIPINTARSSKGSDITKIKVMDFVSAEGEPIDLAIYTHVLLELMRAKIEKEGHEKEVMEKLGAISFEDLMKMEREEEE